MEETFNFYIVKHLYLKKLEQRGYKTKESFKLEASETKEKIIVDIFALHNSGKKIFIHILEKQNKKLENKLQNLYKDKNLRIVYIQDFKNKLKKLNEISEKIF